MLSYFVKQSVSCIQMQKHLCVCEHEQREQKRETKESVEALRSSVSNCNTWCFVATSLFMIDFFFNSVELALLLQ